MTVWPMGCKAVKSEDELERLLKDPMFAAQAKIDGVRCIAHIDMEGNIRYTTRGASVNDPSQPIDITHRLHHFPKEFKELAGSVLDGELYSRDLSSAEVSGMINHKSKVPVSSGIDLYVFDLLKYQNKDLCNQKWATRVELLESLRRLPPYFMNTDYCLSEKTKRWLLSTELEANREGVVFKNLSALYVNGPTGCKKPNKTWYKYKKKDTVDVRIIGAEPPEEFYRDPDTKEYDYYRHTKPWSFGWFGSIVFESLPDALLDGGEYFQGNCSGISDAKRQTMSDGGHGIRPEYIGRIMEVEYFEKTTDGNLRHPRFVRLREEVEK